MIFILKVIHDNNITSPDNPRNVNECKYIIMENSVRKILIENSLLEGQLLLINFQLRAISVVIHLL